MVCPVEAFAVCQTIDFLTVDRTISAHAFGKPDTF